ncbi:MAG: hypothetical protein IJI57_05985 [Flexilinea sp.]|nr:hypothetical protein [Flexilinea sp.]
MQKERWDGTRLKIKKLNTSEWILTALLLLILFITIRTNWYVAHHIIDDDAASELMLSNLMKQDKSLFPTDWFYSTELILHNQLVYGFFFIILDGWANVRFCGTCVIQILYLLSFFYMMSQSGLNRKAILIGSILILLPYCVSYGRSILFHCFYVPRLAPGFLLTGLFFSFLKEKKFGTVPYLIRMFLLVIISFVNSMLYVRQVIITMLPLLGCLFFFLLSHTEKDKTDYQRWMLIPVIMTAAGCCGMLCNSWIMIPSLGLYQQTDQTLKVLPFSQWGAILEALLMQFGFRTNVKIFSVVGILSLGGLLCAVIMIFFSSLDLFRKEIKDFREYVLRTMLPVGLLINLFIFIFGEVPFRLRADYSRYLVPASVWVIPAICCRISMPHRLPHIKRVLFFLCLSFFVLNGVYNERSFRHAEDFGQPYDGLSYDNPHLADDLQTAVEYIRRHEYDMGYAFAGEANTMVELLNGFPIVSLRRTPDAAFEYTNWLSLKSYKTLPAKRAFFLMRTDDEVFYKDQLTISGAERVYFDDEGYVIYDISDIPRFREEIREPLQ